MTVAGWGFYSLDYVSLNKKLQEMSLFIFAVKLKGIVSDAMRELFAKALVDLDQHAKYAVNEIQKQVGLIFFLFKV